MLINLVLVLLLHCYNGWINSKTANKIFSERIVKAWKFKVSPQVSKIIALLVIKSN